MSAQRRRVQCPGFQSPEVIRERLAVLYAKADRIVAYNESCAAGHPDLSLLDEKQQDLLLIRFGRPVGAPVPLSVRITIGQTIDVLLKRLARVEQKAAA